MRVFGAKRDPKKAEHDKNEPEQKTIFWVSLGFLVALDEKPPKRD